jgi:plastocyanin
VTSAKRLGRTIAIAVASAACAGALLVPSAALGGAHAAATHGVSLHEFRFHPGTLTIRRGDKVTWVWRDQTEHNVTFHGFHSRTQVHGSYTVRFTHAGTFSYRCTIHAAEGMRGKIVVR